VKKDTLLQVAWLSFSALDKPSTNI